MKTFWEKVWAQFGPEAAFDAIAQAAPRVFAGIFVGLLFFVVARLLNKGVRALAQRAKLDQTLTAFIQTVTRYTIGILGILAVLGQFGVDVTSILASLGVVGLTIGFAARDTLSNLISGLFILWDRPFVIGDLIEIGGNYGRVDNITLRSTRVVTVDGKMLAIPNTEIVNSTVASYTNFPHLRLDIELTVGVNEDLDRLRELFSEEVKQMEGMMLDRPSEMMLKDCGDYNLTLQFRAWLEDEKQHVKKRFEMRERVYRRFLAEGVDMPNETIQLAPFQHAAKAA